MRVKSVDQSYSFAENTKKRQKSLNYQKGEKLGKRILSINQVSAKNSLLEQNFQDIEFYYNRTKLI